MERRIRLLGATCDQTMRRNDAKFLDLLAQRQYLVPFSLFYGMLTSKREH